MKKTFTIIIFLINYIVCGQGLNGELAFNEDYSQYSSGIVAVDEFSFFVKSQSNNSSFFTTCSLIKIDTLENILWDSPISPQVAEYIQVNELIQSENGGVYLLGMGLGTCDIAGDCFWFIQKYNSLGTLIWSKTWTDINCQANLSGLSLIDSNELLVNYSNLIDSKIYTLGPGGSITDSLEIYRFELEGINDLVGYQKTAFKQDSVFGFDSFGTIVATIGFSSTVQTTKVFNDTLYVLTQDSLYTFDSSFNEVSSTSEIGYSDYSNLKVSSNKIKFMSHGISNQFVITLNRQLQLTNLVTIPIVLELNTDKDFNNSHFSTSINFALTQYTSIRHLDFSLSSNQNSAVNSTDIGIIDILPTQVTINPYQNLQGIYQYDIYADVLVKNFGNNTLTDCRINHAIQQATCGMYYYSEYFSNLNLAPNDSVWITLGLMHSQIGSFLSDTLLAGICVYTSHPNYKTDLNVANDQSCTTVLLGYANLEEASWSQLTIYPNPVKTSLNIQLTYSNNSHFTIYSTQGALIKKGEIDSAKIDVTELSKGLYILFITSDNGVVEHKKRFIIE